MLVLHLNGCFWFKAACNGFEQVFVNGTAGGIGEFIYINVCHDGKIFDLAISELTVYFYGI